jgi:hypothetical protein
MTAKLDHYLTAWQLSDPQPLARTPTSHRYTVTRERALNVAALVEPHLSL